jgi:alkanesulfonate monooxygenase SsuD/methylene tetrahydromethanopterin reductase-like flavin-dependent oxidoreductase (luciferase family)
LASASARAIRIAKNSRTVAPPPPSATGSRRRPSPASFTQPITRPGAIRPIYHRGKHFHVDGPLNVPRSPQGHPVLVQAGGSPSGLDLAARYADAARNIVVNLARRERLTVRQILDRVLTWHRLVIGSPEQLADAIEEWFVAGAVDGFNLMPDVNPRGIEDFVHQVIPILRRRGLFRTQCEGTTLRDHLGLSRQDQLSSAA